VLDYGLIEDFLYIRNLYGISEIGKVAVTIRDLELNSMTLISLLVNIPKEKFRCYITRPSQKIHWNF